MASAGTSTDQVELHAIESGRQDAAEAATADNNPDDGGCCYVSPSTAKCTSAGHHAL